MNPNPFAPGRPVPGRAETPDAKRKVMDTLHTLWLRHPTMRLGQLLEAATTFRNQDLFVVEDEALLDLVRKF